MRAGWLRPLVLLLAVAAAPACFQIEYGLTLERDLSGRADLDVTVDLERMAYGVAYFQRGLQGEEGPPLAAEVDAARTEIRAQMEDGALREESLREQVAADLPRGIEVIDAVQRRDGMKLGVEIALRFDHIGRLRRMDLAPGATAGSDSRPFGGLELAEEGSTLVLRNEPVDPLTQAEQNVGMIEGGEGLVDAMFRDMRIAFSIGTPFEVIEHNATRREGDRLFWIYDYETMKRGGPQSIYARFRKQGVRDEGDPQPGSPRPAAATRAMRDDRGDR